MAKRAVYAFAGYVYCACGEKMYVRSNTPKYVCMKCRTKIPIVDLDQVFQHELEAFTRWRLSGSSQSLCPTW
jgi:site-specific DNA recombinase